ncbi:hypothetical protein K9L05_03975 [Candidatus Babeliales bacterium]|nr:hypothetical protein [Candidatus Babeliales bacterium]MCF7899775.1 hypothetical protein [Candidatus Babeliales bacterium]
MGYKRDFDNDGEFFDDIDYLENNEDEVVHRILIKFAWDIKEPLANDILLPLKATLNGCAEFNGWYMRDIVVNSKRVAMIVQIGPETSMEDLIKKFRNVSDPYFKEDTDLYVDTWSKFFLDKEDIFNKDGYTKI